MFSKSIIFTCLFICTTLFLSGNEKKGLKDLFPNGIYDKDDNNFNTDKLKGKVIGIYFSAHWCPPCRHFTPKLVEYHKNNKENFEVVFVSSDSDKASMKGYMDEAKMPWYVMGYKTPAVQNLKKKYNIRGIPSLILVNDKGEVISTNGRGLVTQGVSATKIAAKDF